MAFELDRVDGAQVTVESFDWCWRFLRLDADGRDDEAVVRYAVRLVNSDVGDERRKRFTGYDVEQAVVTCRLVHMLCHTLVSAAIYRYTDEHRST